jgi:hypothetical protein
LHLAREDAAKFNNFEGRADEATETGSDGEFGEAIDLVGDVWLVTDLGDGVAIEAGEDGHAENERGRAVEFGGGFLGGPFGGAHHFGTAAGVDGKHLDIELNGGSDSFGDGVGDVVKFQVEKDIQAESAHLPDNIGTAGGEEFAADLDGAEGGGELTGESEALIGGGNIQCEDDRITHWGNENSFGSVCQYEEVPGKP